MIIFSENLRWSEKLEGRKRFWRRTDSIERIKSRLLKGQRVHRVYCVCFPSNEDNLLDIYKADELCRKHYGNRETVVIALAESKDRAEEMVAEIIGVIYNETGGFNLREYF